MKIRTKAGISALQEGRIKEIAEAIVKLLQLEDFKEMEIDSIYDTFSEAAFVKTKDMEIIIAYPRVKEGKLEYNRIECKYKDKFGETKAKYIIKENSLEMELYACGLGKIIIKNEKDLIKLAKKSPKIFALLPKMKEKVDPVELLPKIQEILGVKLREFEEFKIEQIFYMKKGEIVGIGEITKEYFDCYSLEEKVFKYGDPKYQLKFKGSDEIRMVIKGSYKELKDVSVKNLKSLAMKKKNELIKKIKEIEIML